MKAVIGTLIFLTSIGLAYGQSTQSPLAPPKPPATPTGPRTFLKIGDKAPDFALPNGDGQLVTLSEYTARSPVVLIFYRGYW